MAKFTEIALADMDAFLVERGFKRLVLPGTVEATYGKRVYCQGDDMQLTLRVYTSITDRHGTREKGSDAIRVCLFYRQIIVAGNGDETAADPRLIGGDRRVHRVMGWRNNLQNRLDNWPEMLGPKCYKCHLPMVEREGKRGKFWGCIGYRKEGGCNGTIEFGQESAPRCPECERPMKLRNGQRGEFWGCSAYPSCRGTRNVEKTA